MGTSREKLLTFRDTGVSYQYSKLNTESKLVSKFLGVLVNFQGMTLSLIVKKEKKIQEQC